MRRTLTAHGWRLHRTATGDHELWAAEHAKLRMTADRKIKSHPTANGIMKRAGIDHGF